LQSRWSPRSRAEPGQRVLGSNRAVGLPVPAGPRDWGHFGPASISWRVIPTRPAGGRPATLLIQSLKSFAMGGHRPASDYLAARCPAAPHGGVLATIVYGDSASARRAAEMVERLPLRVEGTGSDHGIAVQCRGRRDEDLGPLRRGPSSSPPTAPMGPAWTRRSRTPTLPSRSAPRS